MSQPNQKAGLRESWKKCLLPEASTRQKLSEQTCVAIAAHPLFQNAQNVAIFSPKAHEIDLSPLWKQFPLKCAFPKALITARQLIFFHIETLEELTPGYAQLLEPPVVAKREVSQWTKSDLVLVPGLTFDRTGGRLGFGMGFYDRFLSSTAAKAQRWGISFDERISPVPLPMEDHDIRMQGLATPTGVFSL